jgi:hypothetical protein
MNGRTLDVFCVSNKWYEKYCPKGNTEFVEASGIPDLRRFCHTVTADAQLNEAKHFLKSRLSALLNTLDLWASSLLQKQDEIEEPDESIQTRVTELIDQVRVWVVLLVLMKHAKEPHRCLVSSTLSNRTLTHAFENR